MNLNKYIMIILGLGAVFLVTGCEEVIELDLQDTEARIVIAADLDVSSQTIDVLLTQSNSFYGTAIPVWVDNAQIELRSPTQKYTLTEIEKGRYQATSIVAAPNDTFTLMILIDAQVYTAEATVPTASPLIDLKQNELSDLPFRDAGSIRLSALIDDDPLADNFYRIKLSQSGAPISDGFTVFDDIFAPTDGDFSVPIRETFLPQDTVQVSLLSTNKAYYDFFYQLVLVTDPRSNDITPFNPQGNFDNNAVGYFGIYHTSTLEKIIE